MSTKYETENSGIEFSFLNSWENWDDHGILDLYFYDVTLKPEVFGEDFIKQYEGKTIDVGMWLSTSQLEVYVEDCDEPVLVKKIKAILK